jgi:hypothetical protein
MDRVEKMAKQRRLAHATSQTAYHNRKTATHKRVQVWVPVDKIDDFKASFKRMEKKWK